MDNSLVIDITRIKTRIDEYVKINQDLDVKITESKEILDMKKLHLDGTISIIGDFYYISMNIKGIMVLPSSMTLKPVDYSFDTNIEGNIEEMLEEINEIDKKRENSIDIFPIIWENILMEIPIKVEGEDSNPTALEGNGWKFITDDEPKINPEFEKLNDLK